MNSWERQDGLDGFSMAEKDRYLPWEESLTRLLDTHPQQIDGQISYLVSGGAALALLVPGSRDVGQRIDLDIITATDEFAHQISSNHIDAKSARLWLIDRDLEVTEGKQQYLLSTVNRISWQGREVLTISTAILYLSKRFSYRGRGTRLKDIQDLQRFSLSPDDWQLAFIQLTSRDDLAIDQGSPQTNASV